MGRERSRWSREWEAEGGAEARAETALAWAQLTTAQRWRASIPDSAGKDPAAVREAPSGSPDLEGGTKQGRATRSQRDSKASKA